MPVVLFGAATGATTTVDPHMTRSKCSEADKAPSTKSYIRPIPAEKLLYFVVCGILTPQSSPRQRRRQAIQKTFTAFSVVPNRQYGANLLLDWPLKKGKEGVEEGVSK